MFQEEYKKAYNQIKANENSVEKILSSEEIKQKDRGWKKKYQPVFITIVVVAVFVFSVLNFTGTTISALADEIAETFGYSKAESGIRSRLSNRYSNKWNKGFVPAGATARRNGVIMTVENVMFIGTDAVIVVSFANEEGCDFIQKNMDYNWMDLSLSLQMETGMVKRSEISFTEFDEENEKLYVVYTAHRSTKKVVDGENMRLTVNNLFAYESSEYILELAELETDPDTKMVKLPVGYFESDVVEAEGEGYPYKVSVLDMTPLSEIKSDEVKVTGTAYVDGMLRIQVCHGRSQIPNDAKRVAMINRYDEDGEEVLPQAVERICWYERVNGEFVEFVEYYFSVSEEEARELVLPVTFMEWEGSMNTVWEVNFPAEK